MKDLDLEKILRCIYFISLIVITSEIYFNMLTFKEGELIVESIISSLTLGIVTTIVLYYARSFIKGINEMSEDIMEALETQLKPEVRKYAFWCMVVVFILSLISYFVTDVAKVETYHFTSFVFYFIFSLLVALGFGCIYVLGSDIGENWEEIRKELKTNIKNLFKKK